MGIKQLARRVINRAAFTGSADFWDHRYDQGGTSGPGSYGQLAEFKAEILNKFVAEHKVKSVIELGCGDGAQLALAEYPAYFGADVSKVSVRLCQKKFADDKSKQFVHIPDGLTDLAPAELTLSLDVIYHLVEQRVFERHMVDLFRLSTKWVIIYASNEERNVKTLHVRHRKFSDWTDQHASEWRMVERIPNRHPVVDGVITEYTSYADFYIFEKHELPLPIA